MEKYEKMVAAKKEKSEEMVELAIKTMEDMYNANIKISVAELVRKTNLSRGFFYNNPIVKQRMLELKENQEGKVLVTPKSEAIAKAQEKRIQTLERKLSESVPISTYNELLDKYKKLQADYKNIKTTKMLNVYENL
ncbi:MAG: DUF6262 family protein [Lachnospiraceae bacterium]|nr:DUF6262 family protein [Lachnospiraceae bacterium]